jgi:hypothetical protein
MCHQVGVHSTAVLTGPAQAQSSLLGILMGAGVLQPSCRARVSVAIILGSVLVCFIHLWKLCHFRCWCCKVLPLCLKECCSAI